MEYKYLIVNILYFATFAMSLMKVPKLNWWTGYRTLQSMRNAGSWNYAHRTLGKTLRIVSIICVWIAVICLIAFDENTRFELGYIYSINFYLISFGGTIMYVEIMLFRKRKEFETSV